MTKLLGKMQGSSKNFFVLGGFQRFFLRFGHIFMHIQASITETDSFMGLDPVNPQYTLMSKCNYMHQSVNSQETDWPERRPS